MDFFKKGISGFTIKILALIFMTFDHIAAFMPQAEYQHHCLYSWLLKDFITLVTEKNI